MARSPGMMINDKVRLFEQLATGAMGEVWIAEHATLQTEVAVKFLHPDTGDRDAEEAIERFSIEAAASAKIRSPHVVQTFDHGVTEDGTPYIVMELLEGETLGQRMAGGRSLPIDVTVDVVTHVGKAIDAAHALGIVHRDIKPDNIFLQHTPDGETFAKVLDFGTAKQEYMSSNARLTAPGTLVGTPSYMSRDQILDPDHVTPAMDRWALAVVAYRCLTGQHPFRGDGPAEVCAAIVERAYTPPSTLNPELPPAVDAWFERAVATDAAERHASGRALADALREAVGAPPRPTPSSALAVGPAASPAPASAPVAPDRGPPSTASAPPAPVRLSPLVIGGAGVLLIGAGVALLVLPGAQRDARSAPSASTARSASPASAVVTASATAPPTAAGAATPPPPPSVAPAPMTPRAPAKVLATIRDGRIPIPAGRTTVGCVPADPHCKADERPGGTAEVPAFRIDAGEVTVAAFATCVDARVCSADGLDRPTQGHPFRCNWAKPGRDQHPVNCVDARQAATYCSWAGGQLPSEVQWARAARGDDERILPWGAVFATCPFAIMRRPDLGCQPAGTRNVGSKAQGKSPFGVLHLAGNVSEWTADAYGPSLDPSPHPASGDAPRAVRGGSWSTPTHAGMRISARASAAPDERRPDIGFRCVE